MTENGLADVALPVKVPVPALLTVTLRSLVTRVRFVPNHSQFVDTQTMDVSGAGGSCFASVPTFAVPTFSVWAVIAWGGEEDDGANFHGGVVANLRCT